MQERRVTSWLELQDLMFAGSWNEPLHRFRTSFVFRGVPDAKLDLTATLNRQGAFVRQERDLLRAFRKYARGVPGTERLTSIWDWLALAQHHGMPTRLLDWTFSPYVALHFMTERVDLMAEDGAVWCVDYHKTNEQLPRPLREQLKVEGADVFTAEMLALVAQDLPTFDGLGEHPFVLFFEPPSLDARIVNQFALFSVMNGPGLSLNDFLGHQHQGVRRLVVPASLKWEIRDKLDQANITERVLFPGLDGLSRWLRRYYAPRPR